METFTSDRKRMSTIIKLEDNEIHRLHIKGASEYIQESCDKILDLSSGKVMPLGEDYLREANQAIESFARKSLRTIGMAFVDLQQGCYDQSQKNSKGVL